MDGWMDGWMDGVERSRAERWQSYSSLHAWCYRTSLMTSLTALLQNVFFFFLFFFLIMSFSTSFLRHCKISVTLIGWNVLTKFMCGLNSHYAAIFVDYLGLIEFKLTYAWSQICHYSNFFLASLLIPHTSCFFTLYRDDDEANTFAVGTNLLKRHLKVWVKIPVHEIS